MDVEAGIDTPFRFARKGSGVTAAEVGSPVFAGGALISQNRGAIHLATKLRALRGGHDEIVSVGVNERSRETRLSDIVDGRVIRTTFMGGKDE